MKDALFSLFSFKFPILMRKSGGQGEVKKRREKKEGNWKKKESRIGPKELIVLTLATY